MTIADMLANKEEIYLVWGDPWSAVDINSDLTTAHVEHTSTVQDCINIARGARMDLQATEAELLLDFIAIHFPDAIDADGKRREI